MGGEVVYELSPGARRDKTTGFASLIVMIAVLGVGAVLNGEVGAGMTAAVMILGLSVWAGVDFQRTISRISVHGTGLTFWARAEAVGITWAELSSVERWGRYGNLRWRTGDGLKVTTSGRFDGIHRLLAQVEHQAPHVHISN